MTLEQFSGVFALLAVQLRATDADEATVRAYYKTLQEVEYEFVAMAATSFGRGDSLNEQGEAWFPKAPEWRAKALKIQRDRVDELQARLRKLPAPLCLECDDTGWRPARVLSGRVVKCECRTLRQLEVLGRRPMPALPEAVDEVQVAVDLPAIAQAVAAGKGIR